jgi:ABC-type polar amino acid transport system ATPase subunit
MLREFAEGGQTLMIVSHSINFLKGLADYLLYMEGGRVVEFGAAGEMFAAPKEARTRDFFDQAK